MATTPLPYLKNLAAKKQESLATTAAVGTTPEYPGVSAIFANTNTASLTATAGAGTLPNTPSGFIEVAIGGNLCKVPFYDA